MLLDVLDEEELGATIDQQILGEESAMPEDSPESGDRELIDSGPEPVAGDANQEKAVDEGPSVDIDLDLYSELI